MRNRTYTVGHDQSPDDVNGTTVTANVISSNSHDVTPDVTSSSGGGVTTDVTVAMTTVTEQTKRTRERSSSSAETNTESSIGAAKSTSTIIAAIMATSSHSPRGGTGQTTTRSDTTTVDATPTSNGDGTSARTPIDGDNVTKQKTAILTTSSTVGFPKHESVFSSTETTIAVSHGVSTDTSTDIVTTPGLSHKDSADYSVDTVTTSGLTQTESADFSTDNVATTGLSQNNAAISSTTTTREGLLHTQSDSSNNSNTTPRLTQKESTDSLNDNVATTEFSQSDSAISSTATTIKGLSNTESADTSVDGVTSPGLTHKESADSANDNIAITEFSQNDSAISSTTTTMKGLSHTELADSSVDDVTIPSLSHKVSPVSSTDTTVGPSQSESSATDVESSELSSALPTQTTSAYSTKKSASPEKSPNLTGSNGGQNDTVVYSAVRHNCTGVCRIPAPVTDSTTLERRETSAKNSPVDTTPAGISELADTSVSIQSADPETTAETGSSTGIGDVTNVGASSSASSSVTSAGLTSLADVSGSRIADYTTDHVTITEPMLPTSASSQSVNNVINTSESTVETTATSTSMVEATSSPTMYTTNESTVTTTTPEPTTTKFNKFAVMLNVKGEMRFQKVITILAYVCHRKSTQLLCNHIHSDVHISDIMDDYLYRCDILFLFYLPNRLEVNDVTMRLSLNILLSGHHLTICVTAFAIQRLSEPLMWISKLIADSTSNFGYQIRNRVVI